MSTTTAMVYDAFASLAVSRALRLLGTASGTQGRYLVRRAISLSNSANELRRLRVRWIRSARRESRRMSMMSYIE